jgi:hypothetical protein
MWFVALRWFWDLTCDFWAENAEKHEEKKQRQLNQSLRARASLLPSAERYGLRPGFLTARVNACPSGVVAGFYGAHAFLCWGRLFTARMNVCSSVLRQAFYGVGEGVHFCAESMLSYGAGEWVPCRALAGLYGAGERVLLRCFGRFLRHGNACSFPGWQVFAAWQRVLFPVLAGFCGKRERVPLPGCGRLFTARRFQNRKASTTADPYGMTNQEGQLHGPGSGQGQDNQRIGRHRSAARSG